MQTIFRVDHRTRYTLIDNRVLENAALSWAARGVLAYLLSRPDDWRVLVKDLERRGNLGRDGIHRLLRELRAAGYVHFERLRGPTGTIRRGVYFITEAPHALHPDWPEEDVPDTATPAMAKPGP